MSDWILLGVYVAGYLAYVRPMTRAMLNSFDLGSGVDDAERWGAFGIAVFAALLWPVVAPLHFVGRFVIRGLRTDGEVQRAKDAELEQLRKLAREYDLPMPEKEVTR